MIQLGFHQVGICAMSLLMLGLEPLPLILLQIVPNHLSNFMVLLCSANHVVSCGRKNEISGNLDFKIDA